MSSQPTLLQSTCRHQSETVYLSLTALQHTLKTVYSFFMAKHDHHRQWRHPSVNSYTGIQAGACTYTHTPSLASFHSVSHYPPLPCGQFSHSQTQEPSSPSACVKVSAHSESLKNNRPQSQPAEAPLHQCPLFCTFPMLDHCYLHPYQSEVPS